MNADSWHITPSLHLKLSFDMMKQYIIIIFLNFSWIKNYYRGCICWVNKLIDTYIASSHYKNCFLRNFLMFFKVIDGSYLYKNSCPMSRKRSTAMLLLKNNALKTLKKCNFGKFLCLHREAKINMESFFKKSERRIFF